MQFAAINVPLHQPAGRDAKKTRLILVQWTPSPSVHARASPCFIAATYVEWNCAPRGEHSTVALWLDCRRPPSSTSAGLRFACRLGISNGIWDCRTCAAARGPPTSRRQQRPARRARSSALALEDRLPTSTRTLRLPGQLSGERAPLAGTR